MSFVSEKFFIIDQRYRLGNVWFAIGCLLTLLIIYFSFSSTTPMPKVTHIDKVFHTMSYLILMLWWSQLYPHRWMRILLTVSLVLMGVGIEIGQSFHPLRYFDVADMVANTFGVLLGFGLAYTLLGRVLIKVDAVLAAHLLK